MRYRALMSKHPFLTFGLPFIAVIVAGSFVLTPATAIRYEKHDRKVRQMTKEEELNVRRAARKVDMKEEYYVSSYFRNLPISPVISMPGGLEYTGVMRGRPCLGFFDAWRLIQDALQRLAGRDLDNWEQKRVERLPGESDGIL
ncbi:cytochrome c oxidase assembly protein COX16 [Trichoderma gracile]